MNGRSTVAGVKLEHHFNLNYEANDGHVYAGHFRAKRPNLVSQSRINARKAELLGGFYYDPELPGQGTTEDSDLLAEMTAFLEVVLIDAPEWWQNQEIYDPEVLYEIYREAVKVDPFRPQQLPELRPLAGNGGEEGYAEPGREQPADPLTALVDEEISTSTEPPVVAGVTSRRPVG